MICALGSICTECNTRVSWHDCVQIWKCSWWLLLKPHTHAWKCLDLVYPRDTFADSSIIIKEPWLNDVPYLLSQLTCKAGNKDKFWCYLHIKMTIKCQSWGEELKTSKRGFRWWMIISWMLEWQTTIYFSTRCDMLASWIPHTDRTTYTEMQWINHNCYMCTTPTIVSCLISSFNSVMSSFTISTGLHAYTEVSQQNKNLNFLLLQYRNTRKHSRLPLRVALAACYAW